MKSGRAGKGGPLARPYAVGVGYWIQRSRKRNVRHFRFRDFLLDPSEWADGAARFARLLPPRFFFFFVRLFGQGVGYNKSNEKEALIL